MLVIENGMFVKLYFKNYQKRYRDMGKRGEREREMDGWRGSQRDGKNGSTEKIIALS